MLNFCIIDDKIEFINRLTNILNNIFIKYDLNAEIVYTTNNANDCISYVLNNRVNVLLLDISLESNLNGLDIAKIIREQDKDCYIAFITAHSEYLSVAYKYKTFDFIIKPINYQRIEDFVLRLFDDIKGVSKKFIHIDNKNTIIDENEIQFIKRDGMKIMFHTNSRDYKIYSSFAKIKDILPSNFIRCHKSFVANINNIKYIDSSSNLIYFKDSYCDIGPKYKKAFLKIVDNYNNCN